MKLLVAGADSAVGQALQAVLTEARVEFKAYATQDINFLQKMEVAKAVSRYAPSQIINVASYTDLELAERDAGAARLCDEQNSLIPAVLAEVCAHLSLPLIQHSSSFVFDGTKAHPYDEEEAANPVCRYGLSKWYGERSIRDTLPRHVILRTDWVFSSLDSAYFQRHIDHCRTQPGSLEVMNNRFSPTPAHDVARVLLAISQQLDCAAEVWGTYHYCAQQPLAQEIFVEQLLQEAAKYDADIAAALARLKIVRLPVQLPYIANTVVNGQKLFDTFGIKPRSRNAALTALIRQIYLQPEPLGQVVEPLVVQSAESGEGPVTTPLRRKPRNARRPSKKASKRKE